MTTTFDPFDELAAMFLSAPIQASSAPAVPEAFPKTIPSKEAGTMSNGQTRRTTDIPAIELLLPGHLPVRGGLWLTPYADALARQIGSTALLRLDGEEPTLQLLRAPIDLMSTPLDQTLPQVISRLGSAVDLWVIRAANAAPFIDLVRSGAQRMTILSSADEAAIVAAYQIVKELSEASQQAHKPLPPVGLAVVGAEAATAAAVIERLNRTTISFLGVEVKMTICLPRMDAGVKSTRYLSFAGQPQPSLAEITMWIERAQSSASFPGQPRAVIGQVYADRPDINVVDAERILRARPAVGPPSPSLQSPASSSSPQRLVPPSGPTHSFTPTAPPAGISSEAPLQPPVAVSSVPLTVKLTPKPTRGIEPKGPPSELHPDEHGKPVLLSAYVPGLTPLPVRPPGHERVELGVDGAGRLHLLAREQMLRELRIVESWLKAHRELIAMACPHHSIDPAAGVACHIFTGEPATLADLHGTGLQLHVLAEVVVNGQKGWYAAPLNSAK